MICGIIFKSQGTGCGQQSARKCQAQDLGVAQLVARYLGVVEAASSSLVTQTKIGGSIEPPIFFYFLAKSLEISRFRDNDYRHILPCLPGRMCLFFRNDDMLDHRCLFEGQIRTVLDMFKAAIANCDCRFF